MKIRVDGEPPNHIRDIKAKKENYTGEIINLHGRQRPQSESERGVEDDSGGYQPSGLQLKVKVETNK